MNSFIDVSKIALAGRIKRDVAFDVSFLTEIFNDFLNDNNLKKPKFVACSSIQNRTSFSLINNNPILVFDCYIIEIMEYFNKINLESKNECEALFYKILSENMYLSGNYNMSCIYNIYYRSIGRSKISTKEKQNEIILKVQQAFIFYHELYHYYFYLYNNKLENELIKTRDDLFEIITYIDGQSMLRSMDEQQREIIDKIEYYKEIGMHEYIIKTLEQEGTEIAGRQFPEMYKYISEKSYIEESVCDKYAAIKSIEKCTEVFDISPEVCSSYIFSALVNQYIVSLINNYYEGNIQIDIHTGFDVRLYHLYFFIYNCLVNNHIPFSEKEYEMLFASEYNNSVKLCEIFTILFHEEMDKRGEYFHLSISDLDEKLLLKSLKKSIFE